MTAAPRSSASLMPGTEARMRGSWVMRPSSSGTLRSARMKTRLPRRSPSDMRRNFMKTSSPRRRGPRLKKSEGGAKNSQIRRGPRLRGDDISALQLLRECDSHLGKSNRDIEHAVGEAPLVVIPGVDLDQRAVGHLGDRGVEDRARRIVVEVG